MQRAKFSGVDDDQSPEVLYLLKNLKLEELLPKARDAVNLFFLNIKANPQAAEQINEASLLRPIWRAVAKKEDIIEQGGLKSVVALLSSQTTALQVQAAKALASLASEAQGPLVEAIRGLNVHITVVKLIGTPVPQELLIKLLEILYHLAKIDSCRMPLMRIRCVAGLVSLLEAPGGKTQEVEKLCYSILAAFAEGAATLDIVSKERGLEHAVKAVVSPNLDIRYEALKVISGFAKDAAKGRTHLAQTNVTNLLFQLLQDKAKPLEEKPMSKVLGIIAHMSEDVECAAQVEAAGIVLVLAMLIVQGGVHQEKALKALLSLSVHEKIKVPILQTGVVQKLSMLALVAQTRILAISILSNLASEATFMREMSVKGIVELANSMPPAPVLAQRIIARIVKAAAKYDDVKSGLVEFGAVSIFTGVMNQTKDDFVLAEVVDVLAVLTKNERIRKVIIACGHTLRIVSLLGSHLFERLELPIITVISNLTLEVQGVEAVLRLNGAFRVFAKMSIWHQNKELRAHALMAVANLLVTDANRTEFIALGGLDAVLYLLYEIDDEAIQTSALTVVARLAKSVQYQETLLEEDIIEHLKELKKQPRFVNPVAGSLLIASFRDLVMALKASGATAFDNSDRSEFWIYLHKKDYVRALKVATDITLDDLIPMIKTAYKVAESGTISLMFKDAGYPVVVNSSDELLLFFMNYQDNKKIPLIVYDGEVPEVDIMIATPAAPAPPAPPPPPPGALDKFNKKGVNPFAAPAYLQRHELGDTKMTSKPQNALLPENLMSDILSAVKRRNEGKPLLHTPINRPGMGGGGGVGGGEMSPRGGSSSNSPNSRSEEKMGEREWFRHVGKWYKGVHQIFAMHPILVRIIFDIIDSRQDHKSFTKCFEAAVTNMPHVLPHMQNQFSQDELADCLLRIGFNVKSSKAGTETRYEFIVRPQSLSPELLLKAILLFTKQN